MGTYEAGPSTCYVNGTPPTAGKAITLQWTAAPYSSIHALMVYTPEYNANDGQGWQFVIPAYPHTTSALQVSFTIPAGCTRIQFRVFGNWQDANAYGQTQTTYSDTYNISSGATLIAPSNAQVTNSPLTEYGVAYIAWSPASCSVNATLYYETSYRTNGGSWQIDSTGLSSTSHNIALPYGVTGTFEFRVRAWGYLGGGQQYSDYAYSPAYTINPRTGTDPVTPTPSTTVGTPAWCNITTAIPEAGGECSVEWAAVSVSGKTVTYGLEWLINGTWQFKYSLLNTSVSVTLPDNISTSQFRVRPFVNNGNGTSTYGGYATSAEKEVSCPPAAPASLEVTPLPLVGGTSATLQWAASVDLNDDVSAYDVEKQEDGGAWTNIWTTTQTQVSTSIPYGVAKMAFRVRARDQMGNYSPYTTTTAYTITNQYKPTAPATITVPEQVRGGEPVAVTWTAGSDGDNNLAGYILQRALDGGTFTQVYKGANRVYTDSGVPKGSSTVQYRVLSYDTYNAQSGWTTSPVRDVINNAVPVVTGSVGADMGLQNGGVSFSYTVSDADAEQTTLSVTEYLDGKAIRTHTLNNGASGTFALAGTGWLCVTNGTHNVRISATDGETTGWFATAFNKNVTECDIMMKNGLAADGPVRAIAIAVQSNLPDDAVLSVDVTNNFSRNADGTVSDQVVWEDALPAIERGLNHVFDNVNQDRGVVNFRVHAGIGPSGAGGTITSISGGFE